MAKLILTVGLPGSGKSTWAKNEQIDNHDLVLVSKDEIRAMLHLNWYNKFNEAMTVRTEDQIIRFALLNVRDVICHNTHLNPAHISRFCNLFKDTGGYEFDMEIKSFLDVPFEVCVERNLGRMNPVPDHVITNMYNQYFVNDRWIGLDKKGFSELIH